MLQSLTKQIQSHFSGKGRLNSKLFKNFLPILELFINLFSILSKAWIESSKWLNIGTRLKNVKFGQQTKKQFFCKSEANFEIFQKRFPYIGVYYKYVLKSVKSLNRILWVMEYWFKVLQCKIWSTNTKPFFWESEAGFETLRRFSLHVEVSINLFWSLPKA